MTDFISKNIENKFFILIASLMMSVSLYAQKSPESNLYLAHKYIINPAFAGEQVLPELVFSYKKTPTIENNDIETQWLYASSRIFNNTSLGAKYYQYSDSLVQQQKVQVDYAYQLVLNKKSNFRMGFSVGYNKEIRNFSTDALADTTHIMGEQGNNVEVAAGGAYKFDKFQISIASPDLLQVVDKENYEVNSLITYDFLLEQYKLDITPGLLMQYSQENNFVLDVNLKAQFQKALWFGATYSSNNKIGASIGVNYNKLGFSYSTVLSTSQQQNPFKQTHQVAVSYTFFGKKDKKKKHDFAPLVGLLNRKNKINANTVIALNEDVEKKGNEKEQNTERLIKVVDNKNKAQQKHKYIIREIGDGIFMIKSETDGQNDFSTVAVNGSRPNTDSILVNNLFEYLGEVNNNSGYKLEEVGDGIFVLQPNNEAMANNLKLSDIQLDSLIASSGLFEEMETINPDNNTEYSYSIRLDINEKNNHLLSDSEIAQQLITKKDKEGEINYYWGEYSSLGAALKQKQQLEKYTDLQAKVSMLEQDK